MQFFSIHILLFGGVTAYNSYFDKDEGPIGGLKIPPKMFPWMLVGAWVLQFIGLILAFFSGLYFVFIYFVSAIIFWMYSSPRIRLKGKPILSLIAIGVGTAMFTCLLGYYANSTVELPSIEVIIASLGASLLVVSMYPLSQVYQVEEDKKRGDTTFSVKYGKKGVKNIFLSLYPLGLMLVVYSLVSIKLTFAVLSLVGGIACFGIVFSAIKKISMTIKDYEIVMRIKYINGLLFSLFALSFIFLKL
jgi:1,4-dihydroxy-2-naphthoate octaprenyltransferase